MRYQGTFEGYITIDAHDEANDGYDFTKRPVEAYSHCWRADLEGDSYEDCLTQVPDKKRPSRIGAAHASLVDLLNREFVDDDYGDSCDIELLAISILDLLSVGNPGERFSLRAALQQERTDQDREVARIRAERRAAMTPEQLEMERLMKRSEVGSRSHGKGLA
jgi:hypothetical protein